MGRENKINEENIHKTKLLSTSLKKILDRKRRSAQRDEFEDHTWLSFSYSNATQDTISGDITQ